MRILTFICSCAALAFALAAWHRITHPCPRRKKTRKRVLLVGLVAWCTYAGEPQPLISGEIRQQVDSKYMSYGLVDNADPILTSEASLTAWGLLSIDLAVLTDTTAYGREAGYGNRKDRHTEFDSGLRVEQTFTPEDHEGLPTAFRCALGCLYEHHPHVMGKGAGEPGEDTQFVTVELALPDLWLEPTLIYERDIRRDNGTYVNLELGHSFTLIDGADAEGDPALTLRLSVSQGLGDTRRTHAYGLAEDHAGLMDLCLKSAMTWNLGFVSLIGYLANCDYVFDSALRKSSRRYEASGQEDTSCHVVIGFALAVSF